MRRPMNEVRENVRVVIVDDEAIVGAMVDQQIAPMVAQTAVYTSPDDAWKSERNWPLTMPRIWVVDLHMRSGSSGMDMLSTLQQSVPNEKVIVLSQEKKKGTVWGAINNKGANSYIHKDSPESIMVEMPKAIRHLVDGDMYVTDLMATLGDENPSLISTLTDNQRAVLELCAMGLGTAHVADRLGRKQTAISKTKNHIEAKLGIPFEDAMKLCRDEGWV